MNDNDFVDYYELLQLSPNADTDTIDRIFRHLAKKTHPDSTEFPDNDRFQLIVEAHRTLADPLIRAGYDAKYQDYWQNKWRITAEAGDVSAFDNDIIARERLLSLLYVQRRRNMKNPGLGELSIARLLLTPPELLEFHLWYLKAQGWVERLDSGLYAITALGVDQVEKKRLQLMPDHLLEEHLFADETDEEPGDPDFETELFISEGR
ncbi:MAG: J domain-containing protein [Deltaproteobacteria bacterium]|nr:J domain-containing protein [Deltaproteobacteria bacterium]TLN04308.1 MAG: J domain-containing protein [bacterium]